MPNNQSLGKRIVLEFLDFIRYKIENDSLTLEEADSIAKTLQSELELSGTADDLARFYGKSKDAVNGIIKRNVIVKPRRNVVLHSFQAFSKKIPASWRKKY